MGCLLIVPAAAQEANPLQPDCRVDPQAKSDTPLSERLDDCQGVLKPPLVGDSEIVEPAPQLGETPIIRPGELPLRQDQSNANATQSGTPELNYTVDEVVDAIGNVNTTVDQISRTNIRSVEVQDISSLMVGSTAAVINTALAKHNDGLAHLQQFFEKSPSLSAELSKKGFSLHSVVAASMEPPGRLTVFARSGP
jgi:hypothetical protein